MRKFSKSKKAAILASIMGGWMIGGSAFAANLLITVPSNYGASNMTAITGSRVTDKVDSKANVAVIESLNKDPGTYSFVLDGKSMFLLRQYNYSTVDLIPSKVIGADTTWSKDEVYPSGIITKGANPHSAAGYNGYVYVGDYDLGTIGVVKYDKNVLTEEVSKSRNLMEDLNKYCGMSYSSPGWVHGEGMVVKNGQLYVVVSINPKGGYDPYDDSIIMQYQIKDDGSLEYVNYTCSARNPDSVKLNNYNDILLHTGIGGYQYVGHGNSESAITLATINNNVLNQESKSVVLPENVKSNGLDFRDMTVWPNGTAYILAYNLATGGGGSNLKVYKTTVANLSSDNPVDWEIVVEGSTEGGGNTGVGTGWFNKLFAEYYTKRVWGEFGNNIVVYTDGAVKPTYTWSAYELAGNTSYHTFNSVSLLSGDTVFGNKALLTTSREEGLTSPSVTTTKIVNINANSKTGDYFQRISGTDADSSVYSGVSSDNSVYTFTADKTISLKPNAWKTQADLSNNILAAVYAHDGNDVTVNAGSNTLQLQVQNSVATPVGVYAGNGKNVTINAGKLNIITIGAVNGNSLNNAIMNDAGKSAASKITVNGDVNISMNGSYGGNGVAVQKTDRWGEASYASDVANTITINGNLTIKGSDSETWGTPINADNVLSRFNNAGILAQVENSRVDVSGTADMDVYGNGITTNAKNSTVSIGGGEINVPKGMNYGYYTLGAYQGTINVNTGKDGTAAGNNSVKLGGDIFALKTGTVNVALTTDDSYLRGIVDNGGTVNMWLQNGASWINQANNTRYAQDNEDVGSNGASHISKLTGGSAGAAGVIFQKSDSKNITIDKYSGNTMVIYEHDNSNPEKILGGNFTVKTAETGSAVALRTDSSGVNTSSEATVNKVLDALANKLYYTDYVNGSRNLDGQVQIAEGLTAASAAKYVGSVKYSDTTGQGSLGEKISVQTETPEGDNTDADKNFLVEKGDWHGNNSGDNVNLALKDKAIWTGNNSGSNMVVNATDSAWTGDNKGAGTNVTLNASAWNGKNDGSEAVVTLKNKASWTGDSSGSDLQLTLDNSAYQGNIRGDRSSVTLNNGSSWSGNVIGSGSTLNMHGDSLWQLKGDNVLDSFNAGSVSKMRKAAAVAAGGGTTVDMTDATAGNLTINKYNGKATFVYQHDANDVTKINGGDITIGTATTGSGITLLTDSNGLETTNKYAINDALNALANKLYYTGYLNGEKNLDGYVKIAEGLTSASATKFAGNIGYDSKTGQGSLDKATVDYGTSIPNVQSKTDFKTTVTGDYVTDKEYRDAGVLPDTDNIYNFTKDATTITTAGSAVTTAKDITLKLNNHDLTITANSGDGIATTGGTLTVQNAGSLTVNGAKAINANNSKVEITAVNATLNGDVSTNNVVNIKATKAAKVNGAVSANGANSSVSINGGEATTVTGAVSADGANAAVTIDSADTTIGSDITANGKGAKVTAKNLSKLNGNVATDADGSVELNFKEGASWTGDNSGNTTMSLSKGIWNGANTGKLNATLTNGTSWNGDSSGAGSTIKLDASSWSGANSGANADITLTNGASWTKGNTADGVTVKADKSTWTGANGGAKANITLTNSASWTGTNTGNNATISLTDSSWSGDNSGAGLSLTADNSKWNGSTSAAGSATLTNGSIWTGASSSADFGLTLNGSTWNNSGASSLKSFTGTNGIVDMTNAAASVTIGSYSGDATVIYKHNSSNPGEVYGGNFTVKSAKSGSKITMLTDNTGVDTTDEDKINEALDALAGKLFYTGAIGGAENNLNGTVKIAEGLTATSVAKQTAGIVYDKTTGQGSADHKTVTPGPVYPTEQDRTAFVTSITGEHLTDKEYRKAGVLSNTVDNNIYNFTKDATTITTAGSAVTTAKDTTLKLNNNDMTITANSGDGIATSGGTLTVQDAGNLTVKGAKAINANNSKVEITAVNVTLNGDVSTNNAVTLKATKAAKVNGAVSASGANAAVTIDSADTIIGSDITANGKGAKVTAKNLSKLNGNVATDADGSVELNFKEGASWSGDNSGNTTMSLSKGTWNGANTGKLNATLTNGTSWTGDSSGAGSTIKLDASSWSGMNSGANANVTLTNGASWSKGNTADGVTVKADKAAWTGANGGAKANITLTNSASWTGTNTGNDATISLTDSNWTGDNSGANVTITANNSKWNGNANAAGSATLTNGSIWTGASTSGEFSLTLNNSTWNNSGASSLKSFNATNGIVDMTNAAASVTIGSYSGDATIIYKHNNSNPGEVYGGNFTVTSAKSGSKITMLTDNTGVDTTDEDKINEALDALAGKLFYTGAIGGAENNLNGTVKIAEGLTATSVAKQTAGIVYDKTTGQGSADHKTVTPGPVYPTEQDRTAFVTSITGEHLTDKEYRKAGVLSNTVDNNIYNFTKDATTITTDSSAITTAKNTTLKLNNHDMTITANGGDGIATTGGTLTVQDAGSLTVSGAKAINANNSKVEITAVNATLNGDVSTNNVVNIKATKAAKVNGAVSANGANSSVSINGGEATTVTGAVSADGANAAVTIDSADTTIGSDITANGKGAKVTAKNLSKLNGNVATDADGSVELNFKEGAAWSGDNAGNTTMSLSKGTWNGANTGKLNETLTNGTTWTGDSSGVGSTIKLDGSAWSGANSGANADITLTNGASWTKGNTADGVTVKADKSTWTGANGGANANITLGNASTWTGANNGANATVNLTDSSWSGDNSGANVTITADNSKWNGSTSAAGSATLTNGSIWNGASTSGDFSLTLNNSTWNNSGASSLKSFNGTNGIVDMTNAAASVTIGSYSGDATVIYKHNSSNPGEVYGGNFTVTKAAANSKITMLTDNTGVDTTDEDKINEALDALAGKLFYLGAIGGAESNLNGTVKIAEGLTATSVAKQTAGIVYDKTTGQGSADHKTVTPGPVYPTEQDRTAFVTSITGEHLTDKEYRKAGVLSNTIDNNIYNFTKDATTITTAGSAVTTAKDTTLKLNSHDMTITANGGDGIATTGATLTVQNAGSLTVSGAKAINANNSKVDITAVNATLNGDVSTNNVVNIKATKAAKVNGAVSANGTNAAVTIDSADTTIGSGITANGKGAKVIAKNISKLNGNVATDADGSVELNFKEGAAWSGDNAGNTAMSLSKGSWNGANTGKLNATLTNGTTWTGDSSGAGSTIKLDASSWNGANSGANANITLTNATTWTGANNGANATVNLTDSSWSGDNSGANVTITADNSKWNGSTSAAGSATLTNGSIWNGASTSGDFSLTLNNSTWNNSGASSLKSFNATNGIVDMTNAAASVTIGSYSGDATVIYKHNSSNPAEVYGGNFTVNKAAANSKITMLTDNTGVDTTDEDKINEALDALAGKLFYLGAIGGAENNLNGTVKIAEGLTAASVAKQTAGIVYDKTTGQGSADHKTVTPGPVYPTEQDRTAFVTSITGEHLTDKEYRKAGVLSNTVDNNIYNFTKDATTITTDSSAITTAKDTTLKLNSHDLTITANSGDGIATTGGKLTVQNAGSLTVSGAKAINANNSKVDITAVNATLNGDVSTNNVVNIKATKAAKVNGAVSANGANSSVSINGGEATTVTGAVSADGANAAVTIDSADTTIGSDITANGKGAKVTAKNLSKLDGDVTTDADGSVELGFKEGASWTGDNGGNTTMSLSKGSWNGANTGKLNATLTNGTSWTGDSSGAGSMIKLDSSTWNGANSGANANVTLSNGASWTKGNTADGVTVKAEKATWTGANGGANTNITLTNATTWTGANNGANATVNLTDSSWSGDNSGANVTITADNSKWNGSTNAAGSATLTNGSIWTGASTSADFALTLNGSIWNNSGASSLKSFAGTNGVVDMTNAAAGVTIGSYSGDTTVIYKHNSSNPAEVYGGNFTVTSAKSGSKITMLTDNTGVDTTDEDKINEALDALAGKLFYTGAIGGAENNLNGTVKIAEGLTATSVAKQTAGIVYDKTTGQGSADHKTVTPGPVYPTEQDRTAFVTSITGEHLTDKEYRKAGVLSNTVDNNIYNFTKDATTITTDSSAITTAKDTTLKLNNNDLTITANSGDGIATSGATLTVQDAGSLTVSGAKAINANNSKVEITAVNATLNGDLTTNNAVTIKATKAAKVNGAVSASGANSSVSINGGEATTVTGAVSADGANAAVTIDSADTTIGSDITANGKGAKVTAKNLSKLNGNVATDADGSVELNFKEGASWTGDNSGNTTMSLSKGTWNGANTGKLNATLTNGTTWTGDSSGAGSTIKLDASSWSGMNSGANANVTLTNGASWSKGNTADGVTVKADKAAWTGANGGAKANITLTNSASWNGANTGSNATVNLTDSNWSGDNSGANVTINANNSKWNGNANAAGSATLTNGSIWNGASTSADFALTLNGSIWNNSGASSLRSFTGTNGVVDMTNAAAGVTIGSYSGDTTVIYKHNSSNPGAVYGGNFTVNSAKNGSKITMLTDRSGVDFSDEDSIANALNSLANKLYYTGYITGERNLTGYVKLAEGLTASSVVKQTGDIAYDKTTGQGSLKDGSVTPNVTYPEAQTKDNFTSQITGEWKQDKEYKLAGVLHTDNAVYDFSKDRSIITTAGTSVGVGRDLQLQLNNKSMSLNSGADAVKADAITIEFKNLDKLDIKAAGQALLAENGGKIILHNTGAVTADSAFVANGAGSGIKADGLTNITVGSGDAVKADAGSIELAGGTVKGDVTADNKGKISINANNNAAGSILTDITGNVLATAGSSVDIGLGTADSKLTGDVSTAGDAVINIYADMGIWTGNADGDNVNLHLNSSKAQWNNIGNSKLRSLKGNGGIINQTDANAGNIDVGDYSGNVVVNYKHTADKDTASNTLNNIKFGGGSLNIDKAAEGSSITLRTDNSDNLSYTETDNIEKLFRELSKKLYYADAGSNPDNLSGHVEIAEGLTKVKVYGDINYGEHGQGNYKDGSIKRTDPEIIYGSSETAMMRGAKSAMASTALLWRSENSDMLQRMGDVRLDNEESGLWARYYGGKNSFDAKNTKYSTSFNAYQLGYDKQLDNNKLFGAAVSYNKGKNTYEMGGHGDGKAVSLSVYGSWNSDKGHYADVIVKGGKLDNDYTVYNDMGHKLEGDYDTWGLSLSAEYGRRMQMQNGFYIDPSVQFTVGRVAGADYSAASDFLDSKGLKKDMYVSQDAFTSAIGRIGLGMGKTTDKAMFYTKFALAHEFSGDFTTTFAAENEPTSSTAVDFGGTWFEWQLGGSMKVNDNSYVYATFEKKFGGDTGSNDWRLDAGLRWSF